MEIVEALGNQVERSWLATGYDQGAFPGIAAEALEKAALHSKIDTLDIVRWAVGTRHPPTQVEPLSRFGQPPVTLFTSRLFHVGVLFWLDGTTTIHDHRFSGAFQVLAGGSLHVPHTFSVGRSLGSFQTGELATGRMEHLKRGDVRAILPGDRFIHSLFHLERPTVTLIVRTRSSPTAAQFTYFRPGVALDTYLADDWSMKLDQIVQLCADLGPSVVVAALDQLLAEADPRTCFLALRSGLKLPDSGEFERLLDKAGSRFEAPFHQCFQELKRITFLVGRRAHVRETEHRFFLALLMNAPNRCALLQGVAAFCSGVPPEFTVARWVAELERVKPRAREGEAQISNVLGLPTSDDECIAALRDHLLGEGPPAGSRGAAFVAELERVAALQPLFR
jgi:hypothetical protein